MTRAEGEEYEAETREGLMGAALAERHKVAAATERHRQDTARNRVVALALTRDRVFLEQFEEVCKAFIKPATPRGYALKKPSRKPSPRVLNLLLSDLHFGSDLDPSEGLQLFDAHVEARRLAWVVLQAAEFKRDHREETELHVHLIGDIIQNQLFDPRDGKPLAQQVLASMQYLGMAIEFLAQHFPKVVVRCTPGNHGRNKARHMQRATLQKWDAIETDVYAGTRAWCRTLKNVEFHIPKTPYYKVDYWGKKAFFTHGDTVIAPGNPGRSLNVGSMNAQIDALNARIVNLGEIPEQFSLVAVGHVHTGSVTHLPNGGVFLSNACLIPPDSYANTIGIFSCTCGQWLWESVPGHIIGDQRFITIDPKVDGDVSLEDIVAPYLPGDEL